MLSDRLFFAAAGAFVVLTVGLALVWPQGEGARSPGPFGHPVVITAASAKAERQEAQKRRAKALRQAQKSTLRPAEMGAAR